MPPPKPLARLPEIVELIIDASLANVLKPAPLAKAVFAEIVLLSIVVAPPLLAQMPPPEKLARLPEMVLVAIDVVV